MAVLVASGCGGVGSFVNRIPPPSTTPDKFIVATFNIRMGYGIENPKLGAYALRNNGHSLDKIIEAIRVSGVDVVALQEVDGWFQIEALAKALNMNFAYATHMRPWWGVGVLSRFPIESIQKKSLGAFSGRNALMARLDIGNRAIQFLSIHRNHRDASNSGFLALRSALESVTEPVVLAGDFNVGPKDRRLDTLLDVRFVDTVHEVFSPSASRAKLHGTWRETRYYAPYRIDYVLVEGDKFEVKDAGVLDQQYWSASDHLLYFAKIAFRQ